MSRASAAGLVALCGGAAVVVLAVMLSLSAAAVGPVAPALVALFGATAVAAAVGSRPWASAPDREAPPGAVLLAAALLPCACLIVIARIAAGDGAVARDAALAIASWFAAIAAAAAAAAALAPPGDPLRSRWRRADLAAMLLLFVLALTLRTVALDRLPPTFGGDEGSGGLEAVAFATGARDNLFSLGWFSFPSLFFAVESLGVLVGGRTVEAVRWVAAVGGALTVVAAVLLGRITAGPIAGWIAGGFLAASHFHLQFSRIALANVWDGVFAASTAAALLWGWRSGSRVGFVLCGLALGLGQYFYVSMRAMPLVLLAWCVAARLADPATFARRRGGLIAVGCVALAAAGPLALLFLERPSDFMAPVRRAAILGPWLQAEIAASGHSVVAILMDQLSAAAAGFVAGPLLGGFYEPGAPMLLPGAAAFFVLGLALAAFRPNLGRLMLVLTLAAVLATTALSVTPPSAQRMVMAAPFAAVILSLPLAAAAAWVRAAGFRRLAVVAASAVAAVLAVTEARFYFLEANDRFIMGGANTDVATELAHYLTGPGASIRQVVFIGRPRMGYASHSTVPYLAPDVSGSDLMAPLTEPPATRPAGPAAFILLPERRGELSHIRAAFPQGRLSEVFSGRGEALFTIYEID